MFQIVDRGAGVVLLEGRLDAAQAPREMVGGAMMKAAAPAGTAIKAFCRYPPTFSRLRSTYG
jgi:hypothetical protein